MNMKYSVLMSVYNKEKPKYLETAIESMLAQTETPDEFIIIKDGPLTAELDEVINAYVCKYPDLFTVISNEVNMGLGPALRKGVERSRNEYIARMDSDDYSRPERCREELEILKNDPELGMVGSFEAEFTGEIDNIVCIHRIPEHDDEIKKYMRRRCAVLHPTVIFRRSEVIRAGNYGSESVYPLYEDYDLFARMVFDADVKCYNIQKDLYCIRTGEDFYERRGGVKYAKTVLRFKWNLMRKKHMSLLDFIISGLGQAAVCVLPNRLRRRIYMKYLRK